MSKRAEEAALKAYPAYDGASEQWKKAHLSSLSEYIQGYEQAEKDTIERVCAILNGYVAEDLTSVLEQEKNHAPKNMRTIKSNLPIDEAIYQEEGFKSGVKSAALTWEDVRTILDKENDILHECNDNAQQVIEVYPKGEDYYGEILKRFNEQRKK